MAVQPKIWRTEDVVRFSGTDIDRTTMTMLGNGGYVVTWRESLTTMKYQVYNGHGAKVGDVQSIVSPSGSLNADV
ncbi:hypothetical protein [Microvirga calopogonii]|uniref:hypothetical protein n=1 Tax=Microvirga calopogonii TaxID=2078013 RepID=UPI000E0DE629|nr:hypothetical protein [Microvirga calopogonii]